ncbi:MAG: 4Fe-4S dicluster domain-containing protein [Candidatus Thiodiazotropha sp. (ex Lucina aurantia)]|uniref:4Fe-4S dicluster domain-containing protein n=1 Tax=Candidatus Thiodiazotropha sp. LNASS1 TaxID=3096260 RepID=UPI000D3462E2|nr:4Fe-4S dicluster domain-containing protein [Candidatus Thiodiazotropha sp. (ex Lucina pensylvanica)]MBT3024992.1 4Fe-4S dicluster domain-containing protein [Candidatus Thiodiazotropha taylori]MBT3043161.1 4Fe-4S dicluster domain-containing protein [Candidatus Thiodiazotropha sp. (ex Codakia orbicularis)]MBV2101416.1 4Fe-4S dicluster domain-containing protein [Candidatus Thiodiazotropha sp. (ex Lucina aurantia)]MBW9264750.1 4Fe-4S dicluster domain-containing protein [Candidatus Thiodiazotroph
MSDLNTAMIEKYRSNFLKEVEANVEEGEWVKMCMQCGVCSGSCPLGKHWDHPPQEIFMMIRANKREEVLSTDSMWMCTSCYNCIARCPRGLPITHIMHGLAVYSKRLGLTQKKQPTAEFSQIFWDNLMKKGRVNELKLGLSMYFKDGFGQGVKNAMANQKLGQNMMKAKRMNAMEFFGGHSVKDLSGFQNMVKKAQEIEEGNLKDAK